MRFAQANISPDHFVIGEPTGYVVIHRTVVGKFGVIMAGHNRNSYLLTVFTALGLVLSSNEKNSVRTCCTERYLNVCSAKLLRDIGGRNGFVSLIAHLLL